MIKPDVSVTELRRRCFEIIRKVEKTGRPVTIRRRGRVVARLTALPREKVAAGVKPWEQLRGRAVCLFEPGESVLRDEDFEAMR